MAFLMLTPEIHFCIKHHLITPLSTFTTSVARKSGESKAARHLLSLWWVSLVWFFLSTIKILVFVKEKVKNNN